MPPVRSPKSLPKQRVDTIGLIDFAFVKFEHRLQECLAEAESRIQTEYVTAQQYMMGQLGLLKSNILKSLAPEEPKVHTTHKRRPIPMAKTEPPRKRSKPDDNTTPNVSRTAWRKGSKHNGLGIEEARRELAVELAAQKEKLAAEKKAKKKKQVALDIAAKKQKEVGKSKSKGQGQRKETIDNERKEQVKVPFLGHGNEIHDHRDKEDGNVYRKGEKKGIKEMDDKGRQEEEEEEEEGGGGGDLEDEDEEEEEEEGEEEEEEDLYSSESEEQDDTDSYGTPPSPTPVRPENERSITRKLSGRGM